MPSETALPKDSKISMGGTAIAAGLTGVARGGKRGLKERKVPRVLPRGFGDLARTDAACADVHPLDCGAHHHANALQIRQPPAAGNIVGMTDPITEHGGLAAD